MENADLLREAAAWFAASAADRGSIVAQIAAQIPGFSLSARHPLRLHHAASDTEFCVIPGGHFTRGFTEADRKAVEKLFPGGARLEALLADVRASTTPARRVRVAPFLCGVRPLRRADVQRLTADEHQTDNPNRDVARAIARNVDCRLLSDAEFEWVARDTNQLAFRLDVARRTLADEAAASCEDDAEQTDEAQSGIVPSRFGVEKFFLGEWVEDDWHPTLAGAPGDSRAWLDGAAVGTYRAGVFLPPDDPEELLLALSAARFAGRDEEGKIPDAVVRLARSLSGT